MRFHFRLLKNLDRTGGKHFRNSNIVAETIIEMFSFYDPIDEKDQLANDYLKTED